MPHPACIIRKQAQCTEKKPPKACFRCWWKLLRALLVLKVHQIYVSLKSSWYLRRAFKPFFLFLHVCQRIWLLRNGVGTRVGRPQQATQTSEAGCTTLIYFAQSLPCCAVKIRRTAVLSRARTDLQRAEQAQDYRPPNLARDIECATDRV